MSIKKHVFHGQIISNYISIHSQSLMVQSRFMWFTWQTLNPKPSPKSPFLWGIPIITKSQLFMALVFHHYCMLNAQITNLEVPWNRCTSVHHPFIDGIFMDFPWNQPSILDTLHRSPPHLRRHRPSLASTHSRSKSANMSLHGRWGASPNFFSATVLEYWRKRQGNFETDPVSSMLFFRGLFVVLKRI